ncbi:acetyltransferase [Desulfosporosinus orientis DSM 765]|uniref:Acetyltransferase n=1 Tax=Desulfosporosinus orientis (strain ATCC 19365 / DSM 765 / NCIMB 8382 / VKM B-1628 / Singapore I) TaxID=768706 RepID=G7WBG1_DESOD|nr:GNAT family N-acetyltransferase [Desulfosporosinus orientis]AET68290.1 acetyltransferase [Desulfosporosinus orientis DSM 765]
MVEICYLEGGQELLEKVAPLWKSLNEHHQNASKHFSRYYNQITFAKRKEEWLKNIESGKMRIDLVHSKGSYEYIGYCVSICNQNIGEVESIFVGDAYRNMGIGRCLMQRALDWMDQQSVKTKRISVAVGNEQVLKFYQGFGFFPRSVMLEQVSEKLSNLE